MEEEEENRATVIRIDLNADRSVKSLIDKLAEGGIVMGSKLRQVKNTWLLLDDAQNAYHRKFDPFWHFVIKSIAGANVDENLFVIIAATYDLSTLESPADFHGLEHIDPNVMEEEVKSLFHMHAEVWGYEDWKNFRRTLIQVSKFSNVLVLPHRCGHGRHTNAG